MARQRAQIDIEKVEQLAGQGMSLEQISAALGVGTVTLFRHRTDSPEMNELNEAIKRGRAKAIDKVTSKLLEMIEEKNLTAMIFYLKAQAGWKETSRQEVTGADGEPLLENCVNIVELPYNGRGDKTENNKN